MTLDAGTRLGAYEIVAPLGAGGMGEVYRAFDTRLGRQVAVKVLPERLMADPDALARFQREARAIAAISHPNIVAIHDVGEHASSTYVVLELLEGETLRAFLDRGSGEWREAVEWVAATAEAITLVHSLGIVHRDLKPDNLFVTTQGVLKILDFGLARTFVVNEDDRTRMSLTEVGVAVGTIGYMSPEQACGRPLTASSDIFSLGCILYEVLTGRRAFQRDSVAETLAAILYEGLEFSDRGQPWPTALVQVTERCVAKSPAERFQSGRDVAVALRRVLMGEPHSRVTDSIAVLPFTNSGGADAEYLSDGIAETLINSLTSIPELRVVPRSTAFRYRHADLDAYALGRELQARLLVTGKVLQRGDRLMVQADLVDTPERKQLWGQRFNRASTDIFDVEDEIARSIVEQLRVTLSIDGARPVARRSTEDPVAYDLYLKARHHWARRTPDSIQRAIAFLEEAIARDPRFARAWAGLADTRTLFGWYGAGPIRQLFDSAIAAGRTAVSLDRDLGEGHSALGFGLCCVGDWREGVSECQLAVRMSPAYALAHTWFAITLAARGRFDDALAAISTAKSLEPLSLVVHHHEAWVNVMAGRFGEAARVATRVLDLDANYSFGWWWLGIAQTELGQTAEAVHSLQRAQVIFGDFQLGYSALGHAYGRDGRREDALICLEALRRTDPVCVDYYHQALVQAGLGQFEGAMESLRKASEVNSTWLRIFGSHDPRLNALRGESGLDELLRRSAPGTGTKFAPP